MQLPGERDDDGPDRSLGQAIIRAVAEAEGRPPLELETPLHEAIDPDALARVADSSSLRVVRFDYLGWTVEVGPDGDVTIESLDADL